MTQVLRQAIVTGCTGLSIFLLCLAPLTGCVQGTSERISTSTETESESVRTLLQRESLLTDGNEQIFIVEGESNRAMNIELTVNNNRAVFDVVSPSGSIIRKDQSSTGVRFSELGDYRVIVKPANNSSIPFTILIKTRTINP